MKTYNNLYEKLCSLDNLLLAWKEARKRKTQKPYVVEFGKELKFNLLLLRTELLLHSYNPMPLKIFILRDPKTRKISKSEFKDRIVHHALIQILEPIFDKIFIHESCANRKGKGNIFAIKIFDVFKRKVSRNGKLDGLFNGNQVKGFCLKADIKHYFEEVNHYLLINFIRRKICDVKVIWLAKKIIYNHKLESSGKGMPLGNLTSQFFANVYLNELDYFVKHKLRAKYYIRYVDDFVILHASKNQLENWKQEIESFLRGQLKLELHPEKSKIIPLSRGIDFVGFRNFYYYKLLRKRNIRKMVSKIIECKNNEISYDSLIESLQGRQAYAKHANTFRLRKTVHQLIQENFPKEVSSMEVNRLINVQ